MLPNFLVIGAMKAGTGSLWHYLRSHPDIFMPETKELNFFVKEENWPKGLDWYESKFKGFREERAIGEASPNYTKRHLFPNVPERIFSILPNVKLIYILRNPIDRIRSHYMHNLYDGLETRPINDALTENSVYVQTSLYFMQIRDYLKIFSREQLLILDTENLFTKRLEVVQKIFKFLNIDPSFVPPNINDIVHRTEGKRKKRLFAKKLEKSSIYQRTFDLMPHVVQAAYRKIATFKLKRDPIYEDTYNRIISVIRHDIRDLRDLMNSSFDYWNLL